MNDAMIKQSVIAIFYRERYISVLCEHKGQSMISAQLRGFHNSAQEAERLIARGNVACMGEEPVYCTEIYGQQWDETKPLTHQSPLDLVKYCLKVKASCLHIFRDNQWKTTALIETDPSENDELHLATA